MLERTKRTIDVERLDKKIHMLNNCIRIANNGYDDGKLETYIAKRNMCIEAKESLMKKGTLFCW